MSYLSFDKTLLINLGRSLELEMIHTNRSGGYQASTIIGCNTRKYHGSLVIPHPQIPNKNVVLLSSLDETIVNYGAEFNLAVHQYGQNIFSPNGHKYIREFECESVAKTTYRLGNVILTKELLLVSYEHRLLIRYTLIDGGTEVKIRFKPFLSFRDTDSLTFQNDEAKSDVQDCDMGKSICLYNEYPTLFMQFSKQTEYTHRPMWYKNTEYKKEKERGYEYKEDLLTPGFFETVLSKEESIIFSCGISETEASKLKTLWDSECLKRIHRDGIFDCLKNAAEQFYKKDGNSCYLLTGYPWFGCSARAEFFATPSCTLDIDNITFWEEIIDKTAIEEVKSFIESPSAHQGKIQNLDDPDALLWLIRAFQKYAHKFQIEQAFERYAELSLAIIRFYQHHLHPRCTLKSDGLLYISEENSARTWMNVIYEGHPVTPRWGYVVEVNALWYNALCFVAEMYHACGDPIIADLLDYQANITKEGFERTFWNGIYLNDFVADGYTNKEVRPNQIWAVGLPYSPLDSKKQKAVVDICTKELLTPRGLRTLSPKSGLYYPNFTNKAPYEHHGNFHNGAVWPFTIAAYSRAYLSVYKRSGIQFMEKLLSGYEEEMKRLCVSSLSEFYDGNPPYKGHGAMSYAPSVAAVISIIDTIKKYNPLIPKIEK